MKLPSQKYRNAVAEAINELALWRTAWIKEDAGTTKGARYRVWFVKAKLELLEEFGIQLHADETVESLQAELEDARNDYEICKMIDQRREEREAAEATQAEPTRPDVSTYVPVLQTKGGKQIRVWKYQTAQYDLAMDYCQKVYDAYKRFGYVETVLLDTVVYTAEEYDKLEQAMNEELAA